MRYVKLEYSILTVLYIGNSRTEFFNQNWGSTNTDKLSQHKCFGDYTKFIISLHSADLSFFMTEFLGETTKKHVSYFPHYAKLSP